MKNKPKSAKQTSKKRSRQPGQLKEGKATLREYLTRASETAEKAVSDNKRANFIDADVFPALARDLKHALVQLDRMEHAQAAAPIADTDTRSDYQRRADMYVAALEHPNTPEAFRRAFDAIYFDLFVAKTDFTHPKAIRSTYAAMRERLDNCNYCGTAEGVDESLMILIETLLLHDAQEAARIAGKKGGASDEN